MKMVYDSYEKQKDIKSFVRVRELSKSPSKGNFDLEHLKNINAYIFQDSPEVAGKLRTEVKAETGNLWRKEREYPNFGKITVCYSFMDNEAIKELNSTLKEINVDHLKSLSKAEFSKEITELYKKLDYIHPFPDGNSRTIREFTRTLSVEAGFNLDWSKHQQAEIYLARDFEVNNIVISKIDNSKIIARLSQENDAILHHPDYKPLEKIIQSSISELNKNKTYKIEFTFDKEKTVSTGEKTYKVLVNGLPVNEAIKLDPAVNQVLSNIANHKDIKEKGITAESLKNGSIQPKQLANEIKVNRPEARTVNIKGDKVKSVSRVKEKSSSMKL